MLGSSLFMTITDELRNAVEDVILNRHAEVLIIYLFRKYVIVVLKVRNSTLRAAMATMGGRKRLGTR